MLVGHRSGHLAHGVPGGFRADDADATGVIGRRVLVEALVHAESAHTGIVVLWTITDRVLVETVVVEGDPVVDDIVVDVVVVDVVVVDVV